MWVEFVSFVVAIYAFVIFSLNKNHSQNLRDIFLSRF